MLYDPSSRCQKRIPFSAGLGTRYRTWTGGSLCGHFLPLETLEEHTVDFDLQTHEEGGRTVLTVAGDLDVLTAPQLRARLIEVMDRGDRQILVDLRPTEFVDSSGLSALVTGVKRARSLGGDLGLICPAGNVRRLIEIAALDQVFAIHDSSADLDDVTGPPAG